MLQIRFGKTENTIKHIDAWFDNNYEDEWFYDSLVIDMIKDVDKVSEVKGRYIDTIAFGPVSPFELSGGVKALILMLFEPENEYWGTACGDNCAKWILEIAKRQDITLSFEHIMDFPEPFEIKILNDCKIVTTEKDFVWSAVDWLNR